MRGALADDWESKRADFEDRAARAGAVEGGLRRSKMSALEKSRYIRAHGVEAYNAIPWE